MTENCPRCDREIPIELDVDGVPTTYWGPCLPCRVQLRSLVVPPVPLDLTETA